MYSMDVQKYPSLNIFFKGKVQCPDFTLFLSGLYEHAHMLNDIPKCITLIHTRIASIIKILPSML